MDSRSMNRSTLADGLTRESANAPFRAPLVRTLAEGVAYSSALASAVGWALTLAVGQALGVASPARWALLVGSGALLIYNVDRLRDVERDRLSSPGRTAFVIRNRTPLAWAAAIGALGVAGTLAAAPTSVVLACLAVGAIGLLHRRLKRGSGSKVAYVGAAWTAACVGIPWLAGPGGPAGAETGAISTAIPTATATLGASFAANLIASNLRRGKDLYPSRGSQRALRLARALSLAAIAVAAMAPGELQPLVWIPASQLLALAMFRPTERYAHLAIDGSLLIGALTALAHGSAIA